MWYTCKIYGEKRTRYLIFSWSQREDKCHIPLVHVLCTAPAPSLYGRSGQQYKLEQAVTDSLQELSSVHWKKEEYSLTVWKLVVNFKWFDHYVYKFWSMFHLLSSVKRKCLLPTYLKIYFLSLHWKSTLFKFVSDNTVLCVG
jgi:hypothetical protein